MDVCLIRDVPSIFPPPYSPTRLRLISHPCRLALNSRFSFMRNSGRAHCMNTRRQRIKSLVGRKVSRPSLQVGFFGEHLCVEIRDCPRLPLCLAAAVEPPLLFLL